MDLDRRTCDLARHSRDRRFDGRFFIGVTSTRVYCRPICPARAPKDSNVRYFPSAAAAAAAGFRPCLRCRPETCPGTPAWAGTSATVSRAVRLIAEGALDGAGVDPLAARLGVTARHLRRLFLQHLGAAPLDVALTRRVHFAKTLLDETTLPLTDVALAAGFGSLRRFNDQVKRTFARTPSELRRRARRRTGAEPGCYRLRLAYRPPYDWPAMLAFLSARATPGVEAVVDGTYQRTLVIDGVCGTVAVRAGDHALVAEVRVPDPRILIGLVDRVRDVFDLGADPLAIARQFAPDPLLGDVAARYPGIRTPGAWDGFELAVRAVLGQQVSVRAATTLAGRIASRWGTAWPGPGPLTRLSPTATALVGAALEEAGVLPARARTIRLLAERVRDGGIVLSRSSDLPATIAALRDVPGIGDWTAQYIAMRALGDPDAFPSGDLILQRETGGLSASALARRSAAWQPWRAYAVMLLWAGATDQLDLARSARHGHTDDAAHRRRDRDRSAHAAGRGADAGRSASDRGRPLGPPLARES